MRSVFMKSIVMSAAAMVFGATPALSEGKLALLIDTSGSMVRHTKEIREFANMVLQKENDANVYFFNDQFRKATQKEISNVRPDGSTNLSLAFEKLTKLKDKPKAVVLITDGKPNNPKKVRENVKKLKKESVVICSAYIGNGDRPSVLKEIADESIIASSLKASLDSCLNSAKLKEVIPFSFEEKLDDEDLHFFTQSATAEKRDKQHTKGAVSIGKDHTSHKKAMIVLMDSSGENFSCDMLRESNIRMLKSVLSQKSLQQSHVSDIAFGLFSRDTDLLYSVSKDSYKGRMDRVRYKKVAKAAKMASEKMLGEMANYYSAVIGGKKVFYGKDVAGALKKALVQINEMERKKGRYEQIDLVLFSDMVQSVNKEKVLQELQKEKIKLPENVRVTIYNKMLTCEEKHSQSQKNSYMQEIQSFWRQVIISDQPVTFLTNY